jgi:transposase
MKTLGLLTMSKRELERTEWMLRIQERRTTQAKAAAHFGVSIRQIERLYRAYKLGGAEALVSKKRGRASCRKLPDSLRAHVLAVVRERYADFGPTFALEKLTKAHDVTMSVETLRAWMIDAGLWAPRSQRARRPHPPRPRRACLGELIQIDGCDHDWFEARAPRCMLLVYIDDATSRIMKLYFCESESTFSYFAATHGYLETHGRPVAFYSDKAGVFRVNAKEPKSGDGITQFARAMAELNIDTLCANSPQAKGRVERAHQTLQDRLVKEMRLRGVSNVDAANAFAPEFIAEYDRMFAKPPLDPRDAHRALRIEDNLTTILRWKERRKLTQNLTVHYQRCLYIVEETPVSLALRGQLVDVHELENGTVLIRHGASEMSTTRFRKDGFVTQKDIEDNKILGSTLRIIQAAQIAREETKLKNARTHREKRFIEKDLEKRQSV